MRSEDEEHRSVYARARELGLHYVVGWRFRSGSSAIYLVTRWERGPGYWVRLVEGEDKLITSRTVGSEACISERAIGRTYHRVVQGEPGWAPPVEHEQPCNCWVCEGRAPA